MKPEISDLTGQWVLSGKPQSGSSTTAVLRLEPTQTFTASAMPCGMVPFGCPNDAGSGSPIDGSGTWHLQYGHPRSLQSESNPYTQVVLTFRQMRKGGQLVPQNAQTSLIVQHGKTYELYNWQSGEIDPDGQWTHLRQAP